MGPMVNDVPVAMNEAIRLQTGDVVSSTFSTNGVRMYIAVRGGFNVPVINGSVATHVKSKLGGYGAVVCKKGMCSYSAMNESPRPGLIEQFYLIIPCLFSMKHLWHDELSRQFVLC